MKINKYCLNKIGKKIGSGHYSNVYAIDNIKMIHKNMKFDINIAEKKIKNEFK